MRGSPCGHPRVGLGQSGSSAAQREPHQAVGRTGDAPRRHRRPRRRPRASAIRPRRRGRRRGRTPARAPAPRSARTSAGPSASSSPGLPSGSVTTNRPPGRNAHAAWLRASSMSVASQPPGMDPGHDVDRGHVDVQQVVPAAHHGQPQVHRREPARARPPAQRRRRTRLVDDQGDPPALVTLARHPVGHPDHGGEGAQRGPRSDAVASPGQSERPGRRLASSACQPSSRTSVGRTHSGKSPRVSSTRGARAAASDGRRRRPSRRAARRAGSGTRRHRRPGPRSRRHVGPRQRLDGADVGRPRCAEVGRRQVGRKRSERRPPVAGPGWAAGVSAAVSTGMRRIRPASSVRSATRRAPSSAGRSPRADASSGCSAAYTRAAPSRVASGASSRWWRSTPSTRPRKVVSRFRLAGPGRAESRWSTRTTPRGPPSTAPARCSVDPGALQQGQVQRDHGGAGVDDDDRVVPAQSPAGAQPGVGPVPRERPDRAGERLAPRRRPARAATTRPT